MFENFRYAFNISSCSIHVSRRVCSKDHYKNSMIQLLCMCKFDERIKTRENIWQTYYETNDGHFVVQVGVNSITI